MLLFPLHAAWHQVFLLAKAIFFSGRNARALPRAGLRFEKELWNNGTCRIPCPDNCDNKQYSMKSEMPKDSANSESLKVIKETVQIIDSAQNATKTIVCPRRALLNSPTMKPSSQLVVAAPGTTTTSMMLTLKNVAAFACPTMVTSQNHQMIDNSLGIYLQVSPQKCFDCGFKLTALGKPKNKLPVLAWGQEL